MRLYFSFYKTKVLYNVYYTIFIFRYDLICEGWVPRSILWRTFSQNLYLKPTIFKILEKVYHNIIDTYSIFRNFLIWEGLVIAILWRTCTFFRKRYIMNRCFIISCSSMSHMVAKLDTPVNQNFDTNFGF